MSEIRCPQALAFAIANERVKYGLGACEQLLGLKHMGRPRAMFGCLGFSLPTAGKSTIYFDVSSSELNLHFIIFIVRISHCNVWLPEGKQIHQWPNQSNYCMEQYSDFSSEGQFCILLATNEQQMTDPAIMTLQTAWLSDIPSMQMQMFVVREFSDPHGPRTVTHCLFMFNYSLCHRMPQ